MSARAALAYDSRTALAAGAVDPDVPTAGYYRTRLRKGAMPSAVAIFYGQTLDPETAEPLERWAWQATVNGERVSLYSVWPMCAREPIDQAEHDYLIETQRWGEQNDPDGAFADRRKPVDMMSAPLPF